MPALLVTGKDAPNDRKMTTADKLNSTVEAKAQMAEEIRTVYNFPSFLQEAMPLGKQHTAITSRRKNPVCARKTVKSVMADRKTAL